MMAMEAIREALVAVREECDQVLRTGPVITRAEAARVLVLLRLAVPRLEKWGPMLGEGRGDGNKVKGQRSRGQRDQELTGRS